MEREMCIATMEWTNLAMEKAIWKCPLEALTWVRILHFTVRRRGVKKKAPDRPSKLGYGVRHLALAEARDRP